jgi:hypothetical protein
MVTTALAVAAAAVALAFAMLTFERWLVRRRPHDLSWSVALVLFVGGAAGLAWGSATGWTSMSFRLFYGCGAVLNVPFLAAGQLQLQLGPRRGARVMAVTALLGAFSAGVVLVAPFTAALPRERLPQGSEVFGPLPRILAAVGSGVGATIVFAGTAVGAVAMRRARRRGVVVPAAGRKTLGLALLALGTIVLSLSGTLNSVLGEMKAFSVTLTLGVTILFGGFLLSSLPATPAR